MGSNRHNGQDIVGVVAKSLSTAFESQAQGVKLAGVADETSKSRIALNKITRNLGKCYSGIKSILRDAAEGKHSLDGLRLGSNCGSHADQDT